MVDARIRLINGFSNLTYLQLTKALLTLKNQQLSLLVGQNPEDFIYLVFQRQSAIFFGILSIYSMLIIIPIYASCPIDPSLYDTILPKI